MTDTLNALKARRHSMIDSYARALTVVGALGAGLAAGVFFTFSTFVMTALRRLPAPQGMSAMQGINKAAPTSGTFMAVFVGMALVCVVLAISAIRRISHPGAVYQLAGCALYLVGFLVTVIYHVPHNDALGLVDPNSTGAPAKWSHYFGGWMAWNHVRTLACLAGAASFTLALRAD